MIKFCKSYKHRAKKSASVDRRIFLCPEKSELTLERGTRYEYQKAHKLQ